jgi:hypothetical protein
MSDHTRLSIIDNPVHRLFWSKTRNTKVGAMGREATVRFVLPPPAHKEILMEARKMALMGVWLIACGVGAGVIFLSGYEFHKWRHPPPREHFEARKQAILANARQTASPSFPICHRCAVRPC